MNLLDKYEVTYKELKDSRDRGELVPGKFYRIIDYMTTTSQEDTKSAGHQFDVIVVTTSNNTISEEARVCAHESDYYFRNAKLNAWKIWYCLDNDTERFAWADAKNGKGVIYRMIDEYNNDCPYDFANIMFKRSAGWFKEHIFWSKYVLGRIPNSDMYFYTFSWMSEDGVIEDLSIIGHTMYNDEGGIDGVHDNIIKPCGKPSIKTIYKLGSNIFVSSYYWNDKYFYGLYGNILNSNCKYNTFGNECHYNVLEGGCENNIFGNYCSSNKLMSRCKNNIFRSSSYSNSLGFGCEGIHMVDSTYNTFGNECYEIHSYSSFHSNTFGNYCQYINCGYSDMSKSTSIRFNKFQSNIRYIDLISTKEGCLQNLNICQGIKGTPINHLKVKVDIVNQNYCLNVGMDSKGEIQIYNKMDKK